MSSNWCAVSLFVSNVSIVAFLDAFQYIMGVGLASRGKFGVAWRQAIMHSAGSGAPRRLAYVYMCVFARVVSRVLLYLAGREKMERSDCQRFVISKIGRCPCHI